MNANLKTGRENKDLIFARCSNGYKTVNWYKVYSHKVRSGQWWMDMLRCKMRN